MAPSFVPPLQARSFDQVLADRVEDLCIAQSWRHRLGLSIGADPSQLESTGEVRMSIDDRMAAAREAMFRRARDDHGTDSELLAAVRAIGRDGTEAVVALASGANMLSPMQLSALEAVVAFDGTRPSFLVREDRVDLDTSLSTSAWKTTLSPRLESLARVAACVGRLEDGETAIGTAMLVSPTLALTNRHVAQAFARIGQGGASLTRHAFLDFGREDGGRDSFDRREVLGVAFAGAQPITSIVDHGKLDIALIALTPSRLGGEMADRAMPISAASGLVENTAVAAIGYPGDWTRWIPASARDAHVDTLAKLLEGSSGAKRLAPGALSGFNTPGPMTACHDATTINGNSGSPLIVLRGAGPLPIPGLHYGGRWRGSRTNWAHLFSLCQDAPVNRDMVFHEALLAHGIVS